VSYVPIGTAGIGIPWGLYQKNEGGLWFLAFALGADFHGQDELFEPQVDRGVKLSVLPKLGMFHAGTPSASDLPANPAKDNWDGLKHPRIKVSNASLSITDAALDLTLPVRLEATKSIAIRLGTLHASSEKMSLAKIRFSSNLAPSPEIDLPQEEIELKLPEELNLGVLFRLKPGTVEDDTKIVLDLKNLKIRISSFVLEMGLICPIGKTGQNLLQLSSPQERKLSVKCSGLEFPPLTPLILQANASEMSFPGLCPNFGTLFDKNSSVRIYLDGEFILTQESLTGRGIILLMLGSKEHRFPVELVFDLLNGSLQKGVVDCVLNEPVLLDLGTMAVELLPPKEKKQVSAKFDLASGDFWIEEKGGRVQAYLPGGFTEGANKEELDKERRKRFLYDFVRPDNPLDIGKRDAVFLMGPGGVSVFARQNSSEVDLTDNKGGGLKPLQPLEQSGGVHSILEIRRNHIVQATFFARTELPGFSDKSPIKVLAEIGLRQQNPKETPKLLATLQVEKADGKPLATLDIGPLECQVDELRMQLTWDSSTWRLEAGIDGKLWLTDRVMPRLTSGLTKEKPACFEGLMLESSLNEITLRLSESPIFELLEGMFTISWQDLRVKKGSRSDEIQILCDKAVFSFKSDGPVEVDVQPGSLIFTLNTSEPDKSNLRLSSTGKPITLTAKLGPSVTVNGQIQWVENDIEKGIGLGGAMEITGLPPIRAAMFFGMGKKVSGASVPSVFVYAETDTDVQLYPGVYLKSVGAGLGINRCLEAIGLNPNPERILQKLNTLRPGDLNAWKFVPQHQFYLSLVGSIMVGSVAGDETQVSPFLLWMLLSIDSEANFAVAAKLWLSCSPKYVREFDNFSRPAAEATIVMLPQKRLLSMRVTTKKNPAIERDAGMKNILDSGQVQFSYFMSPGLLDYYLEEASYSAKWVGLDWHIGGNFRTAIVSFGAMTKAGLIATASFNRELGGSSAGASFQANLRLALEVAGLVSGGQMSSYALVGAKMATQAKIWLRISIKIFGKRISKSFSTSKRINAALAGTMGFDSSGSAGIAGSVDIETSICGHDCSVSGRFNVNEGLVLGVRSKVALLETRLNTLKANLSGLSTSLNLMRLERPPTRWVLYSHLILDATGRKKQRLVVLPTSQNEDWLGLLNADQDQTDADPPSFTRRLCKIEVFSDNFGSLLKSNELSIPKDPLEQISYFGSCQEPHHELIEDEWNWLNGVLLQDQRVRAESRNYWKEADQERLADGVLPLDFRSLEEVEAEGKADSIFEEVLIYHSLNQRAHRVSKHSLRQIDPHNAKIRSLRGLVSQEALHLLDSDIAPPDHLPFVEVESEAKRFGLILTTVFEENDVLTYSSEQVLLNVDPLPLDRLRVCPPRQSCVVADDQQYLEVKIPICFETIDASAGVMTRAQDVLGEFLNRIDCFEIYRQLPGEKEPTLIADNVQMSFRKVRRNNLLDENLGEQNFVILDPYLFTDYIPLEFESVVSTNTKRNVTRLAFENPKLKGSVLPEVLYDIRVKPLPGATDSSQPLTSMLIQSGVKRVPLQLLAPPPGLGDLVAQLPVKALLEMNPFRGLEIGRMDGERFVRTPHDDQVFDNMNHLEIWLEESKVDSGGFFGEEMPLRDAKRPESLEDLTSARPSQSRRRKSRVGLWKKDKTDNVVFEIIPSFIEISEGYSYRVFVGHRSDGPWKGQLTELPCAILAENNEPDLKFISAIERIPKLTTFSNLLTRNEFDVRPTSKDNNILQLRVKPHDSRLMGGFEVSIRDTHEHHLTFRFEREMIKQQDFPSSQMDFRCPDRWEIVSESESPTPPPKSPAYSFYQDKHNRERTQLIGVAAEFQILLYSGETWPKLYRKAQEFWSAAWSYQRTSAFVNSRDPWELLKYRFRYLFTGLMLPSEKDLGSLTKRWSELSTALLTIEQKDVEGLNDEELDDFDIAARMAAITRHCQEIAEEIFGNADSEVPVLKGDDISQLPGDIAWHWSSEQERRLSATLRQYFLMPDATKVDRQRNNEILEDLLGKPIASTLIDELKVQDEFLEVDSVDSVEPNQLMLIGHEWMTILTVKETVPNRKQLVVLRSDQQAHPSGTKVWIAPPVTNIEKMVLDDPNDIKKCIVHSSDLSNLLYLLKKHLAGKNWELVKRPHHTVQTTLLGSKRIPVNTEAKYLLPQSEPSSAQPSPTSLSPADTPIYLANLLERLGFAVDVAAYDALGQPLSAELVYNELVQLAKTPEWKDDLAPQGQLVVWLPQENRGPEPTQWKNDSQPTSYGFLKVAFIPDIKSEDNGNDDQNEWNDWEKLVKMRGVMNMTPEDRKSYLVEGVTAVLKNNVQRVRPIGQRWLSLCTTGGNSTSFWDGFDDKRHVYEFAVRAMSRYEPLLRWSGLLLPGLDDVFKAGTELDQCNVRKVRTVRHLPRDNADNIDLLASLPVYVHRNPSRIQFSYSLPVEGARALMNNISAVRSGWQGSEVAFLHEELHKGDAPYQAFLNYLKCLPQSDSWISTTLRHESVQSPSILELVAGIAASSDGNTVTLSVDDTWATIGAEGSYLLADREMMKIDMIRNDTTLTVLRKQLGTSSAPHKEGCSMRLLAGQNGYSLATDYIRGSTVIKVTRSEDIASPIPCCFISIDSELFLVRAVDASGTTLLVEYGQLGTINSNHAKGATVLILLPAEEAGQLRMFRNERLVSSSHLPYCLRYSLASRVHYEYYSGQWPTDPGPVSSREPARISRWRIVNPEKTQCKLVLSCFWDLMTGKEQAQYQALPDLDIHHPLPTLAHLPDASLIYDLYYSHCPDGMTKVFLHLESLYMPLAPGVKNPDTGIPRFLKSDEVPDVRVFPSDQPQFQVTMKWAIPPGLTMEDFNPVQLRLQIRRNALASTLRHQPDQE
jgi:hypothetical protein